MPDSTVQLHHDSHNINYVALYINEIDTLIHIFPKQHSLPH